MSGAPRSQCPSAGGGEVPHLRLSRMVSALPLQGFLLSFTRVRCANDYGEEGGAGV